jgi:hypothetical protein
MLPPEVFPWGFAGRSLRETSDSRQNPWTVRFSASQSRHISLSLLIESYFAALWFPVSYTQGPANHDAKARTGAYSLPAHVNGLMR